MKQNVLSMDNLLSLTAKGRLIFFKNKASNYGSAYIWNFGISPPSLGQNSPSIPKFQFQNSGVFKGKANSKIPPPKS